MVPLTQANLMASADNVGTSLELGVKDNCLNVMPLFHIHGLVAAVLASLAAGGSVICTNGFEATKFWDWLELGPTWYTAVPTIHQAVLERQPEVPETTSLRFIRSSSSSLAPIVMSRLEKVFAVPVVEAYGMSEAAHQIACNPLPPAVRKPGSVGMAAGPEVAILGTDGTVLETGRVGEVAIRGANVFRGYVGQEQATGVEESWFRTGDLGHLDPEGYLFLSGRLKEIINRGGETIAPREIDEALLGHPSVQQALAFSVPDQRLGEQVAAIVVLEPGSSLTELELREFAASQLSMAKVPRKIVFKDEIPRGPTGKLARIGLAEKLGLAELDLSPHSYEPATPPRTEVEKLIAELWSEVLGRPDLGVFDRFLESGGDSLLAVKLVARVQDALGLQPSMIEFFDRPTIAAQAELIEDLLLTESDPALSRQPTLAGS
jgi:acyl-CoA synthetase (AMP-forming)/AMP-acid ligase II/acyl carrier protein